MDRRAFLKVVLAVPLAVPLAARVAWAPGPVASVTIPLASMEGVIRYESRVIDLIEARMNDAARTFATFADAEVARRSVA